MILKNMLDVASVQVWRARNGTLIVGVELPSNMLLNRTKCSSFGSDLRALNATFEAFRVVCMVNSVFLF